MTREEFQEVIDFAIKKEEEAVELYQNAERIVKSSGTKQLFKEFAAEEQKHKRLLDDLHPEDIEKKTRQPVTDLKISDYLVNMKFKPDMSYQDILILAMKREEQSLRLYSDMEKTVEDSPLQDLFRMLAQEEARHKLKLETVYDDSILNKGY